MDLLKDNVKKLYWKYLLAAVCGSLVIALYSFVDTIAIGQSVGPDGTAAIAVCVPLFSIANFVAYLCGFGGAALMGAALGAGRKREADMWYTAAVSLMAVLAVIFMMLLWIFRVPFFRFCGADDELMPYVLQYASWMIWSFPFYIALAGLPCFIRIDNGPNRVLAATVIGAAINVFGDWFLVFPLKMGITGAAIASMSGAIVQTAVLLLHYRDKACALHFVRPDRFFYRILKVTVSGFGSAFQCIAIIVTSVLMNNQIMKYSGLTALAIYGTICTVVALLQYVFSGVGQAIQPIISVAHGAGNRERILCCYRLGTVTIVVLSVLFTAFGELFPNGIIRLFMKVTPEVLAQAPHIIRLYAFAFLFSGYNILATIYLQTIEKPKTATCYAVLRGLALNGVLLYVLPMVAGANGVWLATSVTEGAVMAALIVHTSILNHRLRTL